jgi:hypothetical protein
MYPLRFAAESVLWPPSDRREDVERPSRESEDEAVDTLRSRPGHGSIPSVGDIEGCGEDEVLLSSSRLISGMEEL